MELMEQLSPPAQAIEQLMILTKLAKTCQDIFNRCAGMHILLGKNPRRRLKEAIDEGLYVARAVSELIRDWKGETEGSN